MSEFYSSTELMRMLRFECRKAFWSLVYNGGVPHVRLNARHIVFPRAALHSWLAKRFSGSPREIDLDSRPHIRAPSPRPYNPAGLLNATALARELGVSTWLMKASKRASAHYQDSPWVGLYTTREDFLAWMRRHPDFVAARWLRKTE